MMLDAMASRVADIIWAKMEPLMAAKGKDDMMSRDEVLEYLHITDATLWRWERNGLLPRFGSIGSHIYYKRSDVDKALENSNKH